MVKLVSKNVYEQLKLDIANGAYKSGDRLPVEPELGKQYKVSIGTVRKAVGKLVEEGILERHQGRGTFVAGEIHDDKVELVQQTPLTLGYSLKLFSQDEIEAKLFTPTTDFNRKVLSPIDTETFKIKDDWLNCDLIQMSVIDFQLPDIPDYFAAVPESIVKKLKGFVPEHILDECSSFSGELRLVPLFANPGILYAHVPSFLDAGLELPLAGWSWDEFLLVCQTLKQNGKMPFGLFPAAGCILDCLLNQAGGHYFDKNGDVLVEERSFAEMIQFLQTIYNHKYSVDLYNIPVSYPRFLKEGGACMTMLGPLLGHLLGEKSSEWSALPLPGKCNNASSTVMIGFGVPQHSANKEAGWDLISSMYSEDGVANMSQLPMVFPAHSKARAKWQNGNIKNQEVIHRTFENSEMLPSRKQFRVWHQTMYDIFLQAMAGKLSTHEAWQKAKLLLETKSRISSQQLIM